MKKIVSLLLALMLVFALVACTQTTPEEKVDTAAQKTADYHTMATEKTLTVPTAAVTISSVTDGVEMKATLSSQYILIQMGANSIEFVATDAKAYLHVVGTVDSEPTDAWYSCVLTADESASYLDTFTSSYASLDELAETVKEIVYIEQTTLDGVSVDKVSLTTVSTDEESGEEEEETVTAYINYETKQLVRAELVETDAETGATNTMLATFSATPLTGPDVSAVTAEEQDSQTFAMSFFGAMMILAGM